MNGHKNIPSPEDLDRWIANTQIEVTAAGDRENSILAELHEARRAGAHARAMLERLVDLRALLYGTQEERRELSHAYRRDVT